MFPLTYILCADQGGVGGSNNGGGGGRMIQTYLTK